MNSAELLRSLQEEGVLLWREGGELRYRMPKGRLAPGLIDALIERKSEIVELLERPPPGEPQFHPRHPPTSTSGDDLAEASSEHAPTRTESSKNPPRAFAPIVPDSAQRNVPFPMTQTQAAYWVGQDSSLEGGNIPNTYREFDCIDLDLERLETAWQRLIGRHDMLHAVITGDGLIRVLEEVPRYQIEIIDLCDRTQPEVESELEALRNRMSHRAQSAGHWPPFEIRIARFGEGRDRLFISFDLIFVDAWSATTIFSEWGKLYAQPETSLPPLSVTFRDYVITLEKQRDVAPAVQRARAYWQRRLTTLPDGPRLPLRRDPAQGKRQRIKRRMFNLPAEDWSLFRRFATKAKITSSAAVLCAYADILRRWSEDPSFTLNIPTFNREPLHPQVNDIVGDFTSITLLEVQESAREETFRERALRLQTQLWMDLDHRHFSGVEVQRELARHTGRMNWTGAPVVFTSRVWNGLGSDPGNAFDWLGRPVFGLSQTPQVWLDCIVVEVNGDLTLSWDAAEQLFPEGMFDAMFEAFSEHLAKLARDEAHWSEAWSETARRLIPADQDRRFKSVNETGAAISQRLLHELFMDQAARSPDQLALVSSSGVLSYRELDDLSNRLACWLETQGARSNALVAVVMGKGWEQVVAVLGILKAGAAYLPIDAGLPADRRQKLLTHSEVTIALTQGSHIGSNIRWPEGTKAFAVSQDGLRALPPGRPSGGGCPEDLAYVIYTSGSTGKPKGVMIDHRGAVNTILDVNARFVIGKEDRVLALSSLSFDLSVYDIFGALAAGAAVVIPGPEGTRDPSQWADLITRHGVTVWNSVPALMDLFVDYLRGHAQVRPRSLRLALLSGDWIPVGLPEAIASLAGVSEVVSLGGATEASIWSILYPIERVDPEWTSIPYGRPLANQSFHVLDADLLSCPVWVPGELFIGGIGLAKGYWRNAEQTEASFFRHPSTGQRLYRTGDMGRYLPDGNIEFLGRKDTQVKLQGFRTELGEIEAALAEHPGVSAAAVAAKGDRDGPKRLVGYVVTGSSAHLTSADLQAFLAQKLPDYMVPANYLFLDALPLTANGKLNRQALPEPPGAATSIGRSLSLGQAGLERIREQVAGVLGLKDIDAGVNLLEYGATSIDMIRIANRIDEVLGYRPRIGDFYRDPTVVGLARAYERQMNKTRDAAPAQGSPRRGNRPIADPLERETFKKASIGLRQLHENVASISLGDSSEDDQTIGRYLARRSHREFSAVAVSQEALRGLLGELSPILIEGRPKYLFGSAGSSYGVQTYVYAKPARVTSVPAGVYYYQPIERRLVLISGGACISSDFYDFLINRPVFEAAAFAMFFVAQLRAIEPLYGGHALSFATIEAGLMTQVLEMAAPLFGIGLCQMGTLNPALLSGPLAFEPGHVFLHSLVGGFFADPYAQRLEEADAKSVSDWTEGEI